MTESSDAYQRIIDAFTAHNLVVVDEGDKAQCQAPGHTSADRSISLRRGTGSALIYCHAAGESTAEVLAAVGLQMCDLYDTRQTQRHDYPDGRQTYRKVAAKGFYQRGNTTGAALFHSDRLPSDLTVPIYVCEGEKDVLTAELMGAVAVSNAGGASNTKNFDWSPLAGRSVVVVRDNDKAGEAFARDLAALLSPHAKSVAFVAAKTGNDLSDHYAAGHELDELVAGDPPSMPPRRKLILVPATEVSTRSIKWWEPQLVPCGALTILAGRGDVGKSSAAVSWAARETREGGKVMYLHTEDSRSGTIKPRFEAAGADLTRVEFVSVEHETGGTSERVSLPGDLPELEQLIVEGEFTMVIFDALTSFAGGDVDAHRNDDVRRFLEPLQALADRADIVMLGIVHFKKSDSDDAVKLVNGSTAWTDVPRSVLGFAPDRDAGDVVVTNVKKNLASKSRSLSYEFESVAVQTDDGEVTEIGVVRWSETDSDRDVASLLAPPSTDTPSGLPPAQQWLTEILDELAMRSVDIYKAGGEMKFSEKQLQTASKRLGCEKAKEGMGGGWWWRLPGRPWPWEEDAPSLNDDSPTQERGHLLLLRGAFDDSPAIFEDGPSTPIATNEDAEDREGALPLGEAS